MAGGNQTAYISEDQIWVREFHPSPKLPLPIDHICFGKTGVDECFRFCLLV